MFGFGKKKLKTKIDEGKKNVILKYEAFFDNDEKSVKSVLSSCIMCTESEAVYCFSSLFKQLMKNNPSMYAVLKRALDYVANDAGIISDEADELTSELDARMEIEKIIHDLEDEDDDE